MHTDISNKSIYDFLSIRPDTHDYTHMNRSSSGVFNNVLYLMGTCSQIDDAASGVTKRRHDVTFPLLT
jgi:hypothetical protein